MHKEALWRALVILVALAALAAPCGVAGQTTVPSREVKQEEKEDHHHRRQVLATRAILPDYDRLRVSHWLELFKYQKRISRLVVQRLTNGPASDELFGVLRRRIEEEGRDHHALAVALREVQPCSSVATEAGILYWECSLTAYSSLQPYSPKVAFALIVDDPLENAVGRFYRAHETEHTRYRDIGASGATR